MSKRVRKRPGLPGGPGLLFLVAYFWGCANPAIAGTSNSLETTVILKEYQQAMDRSASAESGKALWYRDFDGRSCTSCHTESVFARGSHEKTGKPIEPMAPSVNPERLTDRKKLRKWFKRNCKWTLGRECTSNEQGDVLLWLSQQ